MQVVNRSNLAVETLASLEFELQGFGTLLEFIDWGKSVEPQILPVETVAMDEFTHDVIFRPRNGLVIVLGST